MGLKDLVLHSFLKFLSPEHFQHVSAPHLSWVRMKIFSRRFSFKPKKGLLSPKYSSNLDFEASVASGFSLRYRDYYQTSP
jgi:hypothetical protein